MSTPPIKGGLGMAGTFGLGGPQPSQTQGFQTLPSTTLPYIAHLYDHNLRFKKTLGPILNKPSLKMTLNAGYQPITIELPTTGVGGPSGMPIYGNTIYGQAEYSGNITLGDVIYLTEQGDSTGTILYGGNVEDTPDEIAVGADATHHMVNIVPFVSELGDGFFNKNYTVATDVANFVRDAVAQTAHCSVNPISCSDTGITAIYNFNNTNPLDALHVAKQITGPGYWWFVDAQGVVWFQTVSTSQPARVTVKRGIDYNSRKTSSSIQALKNHIFIVGGPNTSGGTGNITATYDGAANQALYGKRSYTPTLSFPTVSDQTTLTAIAQALGGVFDRVRNNVEVVIPALPSRVTLGIPGGVTLRYWEPIVSPLQETETGTGTYSPTFVVEDIEVAGPVQTVLAGDEPITAIQDVQYEVNRTVQRMAALHVVLPPLTTQTTLQSSS